MLLLPVRCFLQNQGSKDTLTGTSIGSSGRLAAAFAPGLLRPADVPLQLPASMDDFEVGYASAIATILFAIMIGSNTAVKKLLSKVGK